MRKASNHVRIAGHLIDCSTGAHLWADRFDGRLEDVFELQDQVTVGVVGAILPTLEQAEIERARRKPTENLDAFDYYLRGIATLQEGSGEESKQANDEALRLFYKAIELDPHFASAYARAASCFILRKARGWMLDREQETGEAVRLARNAARLGQDDAAALAMAGWTVARMAGDLDAGSELIDRALRLNPNLALAWYCSGMARCYLGEPDIAIEHLARAMRLNPLDRFAFWPQMGTALGHFLAGRYHEAYSWAKQALNHRPDAVPVMRIFVISSALTGRLEEARKTMRDVIQLDPTLRLSDLKDVYPFRRQQDINTVIEAFRSAGMPE